MTTQNVALDLKAIQPIFEFELFKVKPQDKEDVKNSAIVEILESLANPRYVVTQSTLFSFAQKIVRRTVADYYRRSYRMVEQQNAYVHFSDGSYDDGVGESSADTFSYAVNDLEFAFADLRIDYHHNKSKFTPQERQAIEQMLDSSDGEFHTMAEVVNAVGVHKTHGSRAMKKFRELVADIC